MYIVIQVVWLGRPTTESSWKSAETLPQSLVDEFEAGVMQDIHRDTSKIGGQTVHTICTKRTQRNEVQPSAKKFKSDTIQHISYPSGYGTIT